MNLVDQVKNPVIWDAFLRRKMAYQRNGIYFLNRKGRRFIEKRLGRKEREALMDEARAREGEQVVSTAGGWGESKKIDEQPRKRRRSRT